MTQTIRIPLDAQTNRKSFQDELENDDEKINCRTEDSWDIGALWQAEPFFANKFRDSFSVQKSFLSDWHCAISHKPLECGLSWETIDWTKIRAILRDQVLMVEFPQIVKTDSLEVRFYELAAKWNEEIGAESSLTKITGNINYLRIISLGKPVVPLILKQLQHESAPWFLALSAITGELNIGKEHAGNFGKMAEAWLQWGSQNGYI
jgi:hypothetical protein